MRRSILLLILWLGGCSTTQDVVRGEFDRTEACVKVTWLDSAALQDANRQTFVSDEELLGITKVSRNPDTVCRMFMQRPRGASDEERIHTVGHEFLHCLLGRYHAQPKVR